MSPGFYPPWGNTMPMYMMGNNMQNMGSFMPMMMPFSGPHAPNDNETTTTNQTEGDEQSTSVLSTDRSAESGASQTYYDTGEYPGFYYPMTPPTAMGMPPNMMNGGMVQSPAAQSPMMPWNLMGYPKKYNPMANNLHMPPGPQTHGRLNGSNFWVCQQCHTHNFHEGSECHGCGKAWECPNCNFLNYAFRSKCLKCQIPKPMSYAGMPVMQQGPLDAGVVDAELSSTPDVPEKPTSKTKETLI